MILPGGVRSMVVCADAAELCGMLPDGAVDCCVTSPPYWGLRDYGTARWEGGDAGHAHDRIQARGGRGGSGPNSKNTDGSYPSDFPAPVCSCGAVRVDCQLGLERTPEEYVARLVEVFRGVRRVLRDDGLLWLVLGDSYAGSWGNQGRKPGRGTQRPIHGPMVQNLEPYPDRQSCTGSWVNSHPVLKPKDLVGIPWRVAFALQADGWYLRSDIIWSKPNPMPESVTDRPTKAHEYVFMLAKSEKYYYDAAAVAEPAVGCNNHDLTGQGYSAPGQTKQTGNRKPRTAGNKSHKYVTEYEASATEEHRTKAGLMKVADKPWYTRNRRTVWTVATKPFPGVHFATFPPKLIEPCILAGCPVDGLVLDPFCGSGTTGMVAVQHGRRFVGCDINADYCRMAEERIQSGK